MLKKIHEEGGILTAEDFSNYKPIIKPALKGTFKNRTVYTTHAPSSGPVLLHMLNLHEKFENTSDKGLTAHRVVEVMKCKSIFSRN
jgi:gamma-glutamyltranspeptidase / glutathione hydrolase / leukotriene-C4 hydrolase